MRLVVLVGLDAARIAAKTAYEGEQAMSDEQIGATLTAGPEDWQIVQQDGAGRGHMALGGRWVSETPGQVEVRLAWEAMGTPVTAALDWRPAETAPDGSWSAMLGDIPAGGLYRLETRFHTANNLAGEWSTRGDMRHFLGVGDLWVIAGQSNAAGYGRGPFEDGPELGVHVLRNNEHWALATQPLNESTDTRHPVNREAANPGHSPFLHFARLLKRHLGYPIGLVQTALGGSPLQAWNPAEPGGAVLYRNMVHCARLAGGRVKGILWYQGESDANRGPAETYLQRFGQATAAWRETLGDATLPVLTVQLNRHYAPTTAEMDRAWSIVREAQRQAARLIPGVTVAPTFDLPLGDLIHTSPAGNMLLAERLAQAALGGVYGRPIEHRAPDLQVARRTQGGRMVQLTFAPVTSRMDCIDITANCFRVQDEQGDVPVAQVIYLGDDAVRLHLERNLVGQATVHGGYGLCPATVPMDMERFMPMLGFYDAEVL